MKEKFLAWLKRLIDRVKGIPGTPTVPTKPVETPPPVPVQPTPPAKPAPFSGTPRPVDLSVWKGERVSSLIIFMGRGLTAEEEALAREAGVDFGGVSDGPTEPVEPAPNKAVFDLKDGRGWYTVNQVLSENFYTYTFDVSDTQTSAEIDVFGSPGKFFYEVTEYVTSPSGAIVVPTVVSKVIGFNHKIQFSVPGPGKYSYHVKVDKSGSLGVQYNQR
jgi:hypothetical protein